MLEKYKATKQSKVRDSDKINSVDITAADLPESDNTT